MSTVRITQGANPYCQQGITVAGSNLPNIYVCPSDSKPVGPNGSPTHEAGLWGPGYYNYAYSYGSPYYGPYPYSPYPYGYPYAWGYRYY